MWGSEVTQPGHGELGFRVRAEMFKYRIFMGRSKNYFLSGMGVMVLQGVVRKKDSQGSPSCYKSESLRMWSGDLHFNTFPRCFPCI